MFEDATARTPVTGQTPSVARALELMRRADALNAAAALMVSALMASSSFERATGLPAELAIGLGARRPRWDARAMIAVAEALRSMPRTAEALRRGLITFAQARAIAREVADLTTAARAGVDGEVGAAAPRLADAEPEQLVWLAEEAAARHRRPSERARTRDGEASFLCLQQRLGGGGTIYGEADTESFAAIAQAVEDSAGEPAPDVPRARRRMDALVTICETHSAGGSTGRARPRFVVTADLAELERLGGSATARVLAAVAGRPMPVRAPSQRALGCDADVELVAFDGPQPVASGTVARAVPERLRRAVAVRDGGCRFPGCSAPPAWCDCHHIRPRSLAGSNAPDNLVMLCRRCHTRVHRRGFLVVPLADGGIAFRSRIGRFVSYPRARPLLE